MNTENKKWIILSFAGIATLVWYIVEKTLFGIVDLFTITVYPLVGNVTVLTPLAIIPAAGLFYYLIKNNLCVEFTNEVIIELKKIVWPPKKETSASTVIVLILVFIASAILGVFDFLWIKILQLFL